MNVHDRLESIERFLSKIPVRPTVAKTQSTYYLYCDNGNLLTTVGATNYYGLKQPASSVLTVPTAAPSSTAGSAPDGLSRAILISDSGGLSVVWCGVNLKPDGVAITDYTGILAEYTPFVSRRVVQMPITGTPTVFTPVYLVWRK